MNFLIIILAVMGAFLACSWWHASQIVTIVTCVLTTIVVFSRVK